MVLVAAGGDLMMNNVVAFPVSPKMLADAMATTDVSACAPAPADNLVDLEAVRAEESNWIYGKWDVRELPVDIEDWPQELLVLMANDRASECEWDRMISENETAHRAIFRIVK